MGESKCIVRVFAGVGWVKWRDEWGSLWVRCVSVLPLWWLNDRLHEGWTRVTQQGTKSHGCTLSQAWKTIPSLGTKLWWFYYYIGAMDSYRSLGYLPHLSQAIHISSILFCLCLFYLLSLLHLLTYFTFHLLWPSSLWSYTTSFLPTHNLPYTVPSPSLSFLTVYTFSFLCWLFQCTSAKIAF